MPHRLAFLSHIRSGGENVASGFAIDTQSGEKKTPGMIPQVLLHCCCAPCASYVLEYLSPAMEISILYYNPNIQPLEEYDKRGAELNKLLLQADYPNRVDMLSCEYDAGAFDSIAAPYKDEPEGGLRCRMCFELRLEETAKRAKADGYDYFATTLSVSPHKDAALISEIGGGLAKKYGVGFVHEDFKKHDGFKRSVMLSKQYGLYRQSYCGCR